MANLVPGNQKHVSITAGAQGKFVKLKKNKNIWPGMTTGMSIIIAFGGTGLPLQSWPELHNETVSKTKKKSKKTTNNPGFPTFHSTDIMLIRTLRLGAGETVQ